MPATTFPSRPDSSPIARPLSIGPVCLETNLLLAPVANYCDLAWRLTCRELGGVGLACTDLLSPHGLLRGTAHSLDLAMTTDEDRPLCMQLYGCDGDILAEGAVWAIRHGAQVIDINMGCPVDKVTKKDGGSKLLCDPRQAVRLAEQVVRTVEHASAGRVPVTAKLRLGWSMGEMVAPDLAVALARVGVAAITIHGRYAEQKFQGSVNHAGIRAVVLAMEAAFGPPKADGGGPPVIGNGDVNEPEDALRTMRETGCAGVMIGRGSFSRPWLFRQAWALQQSHAADERVFDRVGGMDEPSREEKVSIMRRYFERMLLFRGEHYAMNHIRRRISWMGKSLGPCKPLKEAVRTAPNPAAVRAALDDFLAIDGANEGKEAALEHVLMLKGG